MNRKFFFGGGGGRGGELAKKRKTLRGRVWKGMRGKVKEKTDSSEAC